MRHADWETKLEAIVEARRNLPHSYGTNDCAILVAEAVKAETGRTLKLPKYADEASVLKLESDAGGLESLVSKQLGESRGPNNARKGDVVMWKAPGGDALGICLGTIFCAPGDNQMLFIKMNKATRSWPVQ